MSDTKSVSGDDCCEVDVECTCSCHDDDAQGKRHSRHHQGHGDHGESGQDCCEPVTFNIKVTMPHGMGGCCGPRGHRAEQS